MQIPTIQWLAIIACSAENCHTSEKDQKSRKEGNSRATQEANERDEISSLSGLSSEDEMKEHDRLQVLATFNYMHSSLYNIISPTVHPAEIVFKFWFSFIAYDGTG